MSGLKMILKTSSGNKDPETGIKFEKLGSLAFRRILVLIFGISGAVVLSLLAGCSAAPEKAEKKSPPATIQNPVAENQLTSLTLTPQAIERLGIKTSIVEAREIENRRSYPGEAVIPEGNSFTVSSPFAGQIELADKNIKIGREIPENTGLFRLIPFDRELRGRDLIADAERDIMASEVRIKAARQKVERARQLLDERAGSEKVLQEAEAELEIAEADNKTAASQLEFLKSNRMESPEGLLISSPVAGMLFRQFVGNKQHVAASTPLAEIIKLDPIWIRVPVYAGETDSIDQKASAEINNLSQNQAWTLSAAPVAAPPSANADSATVDLYFQVSNPQRLLKPGMKVAATLHLQGSGQKISIPRSAIVQDAYGGAWVYREQGAGVFTRQRIDIISVDDDFAVLNRGLESGIRIVTVGAMELFGEEFGGKK